MAKNKNKVHSNEVELYLLNRIKELEKELDARKKEQEHFDKKYLCLQEQVSYFKEKHQALKKLFELSEDGITKAIIVRDLKGCYCGILAIDSNDDFAEYLKLLGFELKKGE
ncbi:MAG: hypothetical protein J6S85_20850 [Methanobrevibacter sp.]|nr:hypothetical protein [Methanobrevibacter sp.]